MRLNFIKNIIHHYNLNFVSFLKGTCITYFIKWILGICWNTYDHRKDYDAINDDAGINSKTYLRDWAYVTGLLLSII